MNSRSTAFYRLIPDSLKDGETLAEEGMIHSRDEDDLTVDLSLANEWKIDNGSYRSRISDIKHRKKHDGDRPRR